MNLKVKSKLQSKKELTPTLSTFNKSRTTQNQAEENQYTIYPTPQNQIYVYGKSTLGSSVNLVIEDNVDIYTVNKAKAILTAQGIPFKESKSIVKEGTNLIVGIKASKEIVDLYFNEKIVTKDIYEEVDAHVVSVQDNIIAVLGKDIDAAFYGLVTVEHILEQSSNNTLKNVLIEDYSSTKIRGIIEGYYGIPWGNENRADLIRFGAQFKNNAFVFAPKDDPYHRDQWRDLYPQVELDGIAKLATLGNETKNRYIWTIAPFKPGADPITPTNKEQGIQDIITKFEQLYEVGVRQFGVLGDDVGRLPHATVVDVMVALSAWSADKGDVYDFVFVPAGYVLADWGFNAKELDTYNTGFPDDIQIMFTGQNTLSKIDQNAIDGFKNKGIKEGVRRDPLFWLNWPVNDIDRVDYRRLFMGKGEMMAVGVTNMVGVLTNPMEESQPSKTAIFAVADYAWNTKLFNADKSWVDGFKYIDPEASDSLHEISKHMSNMDNGGIGRLQESVELNALILKFNEALNTKDTKQIHETATVVRDYYQGIVNAVNTFEAETLQANLKKEMGPYNANLKDKSQAAVHFLNAIIIANGEATGNKITANLQLEDAKAALAQSATHTVTTLTSEFPTKVLRAESGMHKINPHIKQLQTLTQGKS